MTKVTWPSPVDDVAIAGWRYEDDIPPEQVVAHSTHDPRQAPADVGSRRWLEWVLGRQSAWDALESAGWPRDEVVVEDAGAPAFAELPIGVSIAHTRGLALAAVGPGRVGVDVESADRDVSRLEAALFPGEQHISLSLGLLEVMVAKEAAAKATGQGLGGSLARWPVLDVELFGDLPRVTVGTPDGEFIGVQVWEHDGFVAALATIPIS